MRSAQVSATPEQRIEVPALEQKPAVLTASASGAEAVPTTQLGYIQAKVVAAKVPATPRIIASSMSSADLLMPQLWLLQFETLGLGLGIACIYFSALLGTHAGFRSKFLSCFNIDVTEHDSAGLGPAGVGMIIALSGLVLRLLPQVIQFASYCADVGCFQPGCDGKRPNQCIPSTSDVELDLGFVEHPTSHIRRILGLVAVHARAPIETCLLCWAYRCLAHGLPWAKMRVHLFTVCVVLVAMLDVSSKTLRNAGLTKVWHVDLSVALIALWVLAVVPLFLTALNAKWEANSRVNLGLVAVLWFFALLEAVWLGVSWEMFPSWGRGWQWYAIEWTLIFSHGIVVIAIGFLMLQLSKGCEMKAKQQTEKSSVLQGSSMSRAV